MTDDSSAGETSGSNANLFGGSVFAKARNQSQMSGNKRKHLDKSKSKSKGKNSSKSKSKANNSSQSELMPPPPAKKPRMMQNKGRLTSHSRKPGEKKKNKAAKASKNSFNIFDE